MSSRAKRGTSQPESAAREFQLVLNLGEILTALSYFAGAMKAYYVYMMTNQSRVVLYTGITNSLERRLWFHSNTSSRSFTKRYKVDRLVYYERFDRARDAIWREKEIKGWRREKKNDLVRAHNPKWEDLGEKLFGDHRRGPSLRSG